MSKGRKRVILIGSNQFGPASGLSDLRCSLNDLAGMRELLTSAETGLFAADDVRVFPNGTHYEILAEIEEIFQQAEPQDFLLLYYSGHGVLDNRDHLHLTTANSRKDRIKTTSISTEALRGLIDNYRCKRVVMILDCCHSGAVKRDLLKSGVDAQMEQLARGIYVLTASTAMETAEEKEGDDYSLLTKHLIDAVRQGHAASNDEGLISVDALYQYVTRAVPRHGGQKPTRYDLEVQGGEIFIARAAATHSPERLRAFRQKLNEVEDELDDEVFVEALRVIKANQQKRDKLLFALLADLCDGGLKPGRFSGQWLRQAGLIKPITPPQPPEQKATPKVDTAPPPSPKPKVDVVPPPAPKPPAPKAATSALRSFSFETVTLDEKGKEKSRRTLQAECFTEDLGDGVTLELVRVPGGEFLMGSPESELNRYEDEGPQHGVRLPKLFVGRYAITREQWRQVARLPKVTLNLNEDPAHFRDSWKQPVEQVSWEEAVEFCVRLRKRTGRAYRLPSEAEWEYAARGGTTTPFAFGPTITLQIVNYNGDRPYGSLSKGEFRGKTIEVGSLGVANAFGLYDLHGNVYEWCADVYHDSYGGKQGNPPTDGSAWTNGGEKRNHVLRGGSWSNDGRHCRTSYRYRIIASTRRAYIGFRIVVSVKAE